MATVGSLVKNCSANRAVKIKSSLKKCFRAHGAIKQPSFGAEHRQAAGADVRS